MEQEEGVVYFNRLLQFSECLGVEMVVRVGQFACNAVRHYLSSVEGIEVVDLPQHVLQEERRGVVKGGWSEKREIECYRRRK